MTKKETIKKEKLVDLNPKPEKITEVELNKLQSSIKTIDHLVADIGQMSLRKYSLMKAMDNVQNELEILRKSFQDNYGTDNINIQEGTITYPEDPLASENHNTPENGKANTKD